MAKGGTATGRIPADLSGIAFTEPLARPAKANSVGIFIVVVFLFRFLYRTSYCLQIFLTEIIGESFKKMKGKCRYSAMNFA